MTETGKADHKADSEVGKRRHQGLAAKDKRRLVKKAVKKSSNTGSEEED